MYSDGADRQDRHAEAGGDVRDLARVERRGRTSSRSSCGTASVSGFGEAAPIERYDESGDSALAFLEEHGRALLGDDPFALEEIERAARRAAGRARGARRRSTRALHDLQGKLLGVPVWQLLGLPRAGPPTSWTVWLGDPDDMARRAEKAAPRFRRLKLKLGGGDGLDVERVRAVRARHRAAAAGRRERVVVARRGARRAAAARRARGRVLRAAAPGGRRGRHDAEGALADPDLRRRGLSPARQRRRAARRSRTGSTSSSRSRAASARRCGWHTRHARSASA